MRYKFIFFIQTLLLISSSQLNAQTPVDVIESTLKVNMIGEEIFYFGFAAGDKMIFNFEEATGKELKEVEITELPSTSRFIDYKTSRITNKTILVPKTGIFKMNSLDDNSISTHCKYFKPVLSIKNRSANTEQCNRLVNYNISLLVNIAV